MTNLYFTIDIDGIDTRYAERCIIDCLNNAGIKWKSTSCHSVCDHEWTADQDNRCNVCIKCGLTADHF